jgi:hypothetical protein
MFESVAQDRNIENMARSEMRVTGGNSSLSYFEIEEVYERYNYRLNIPS